MKRITLLKPHTHNGVAHASGVSLNVPDPAARWLLDHRLAELASSERVAITVPAPTTTPATEAPASNTETPVPRIADIDTTGDTP